MSHEQRTRLNIMISEQTGAAATTHPPGRSARTDELADGEHEAEPVQPDAPARRSVFDAPFAADVGSETTAEDAPATDDAPATPRRA